MAGKLEKGKAAVRMAGTKKKKERRKRERPSLAAQVQRHWNCH